MPRLTDQQIQPIIMDYIQGSDHPDLVVYRRDFGEKMDFAYWSARVRRACDLGNFFDGRILEVGCGFGWDAVGIALIGDNRVVATDILPSMIDGVKECLASSAARGTALPIEPLQADICKIDLPAASFDGIYSSEAVEHVHDLAAMFARCHDLLKPGGRLLIVNDSNRFNSDFRDSTFGMWQERDTSWDHAEWLKAAVRPVEHKDAKPYAAMREEMIKFAAPAMDEEMRAALVAATAGMIRPQIEQAAAACLNGEPLPVRPTFSWCRNPETGEYAERLLDPFEMADMLRAAGFKVSLQHMFRKWPHQLLNRVSFRPLNKFLFDRRALFALVAEKSA